MGDMLKQGLELKQTQKLSPLQIQTIKLIELPVQELEQRIRKELEENPVLDEDVAKEREEDEEQDNGPREVSLSDYKEDDSIPSYKLRVNNYGKDERPQYNTFSVKQSFTQSLMDQLGFRNLTEHQHSVAAFIIGSLDDDGYLRRDISSLVDDIAFRAGIETDTGNYTSQEEFRQLVRNERGRELCFEALRKYDLIRWGIFVDAMQDYLTDTQSSWWPSTNDKATYAADIASRVQQKHIVLPIPSIELGVNNLLVQNPLW